MSISSAQKEFVAVRRLPFWLRQDIPDAVRLREIRNILAEHGVNTVCEGARCPNSGKCWGKGVVTVMIMGKTCTRDCRFCSVEKGEIVPLDSDEPRRVAGLVKKLNLNYVVVTSVTRDDLPDGGAGHFAQVIKAIRQTAPLTKIEVLIPDFGGDFAALQKVVDAGPEVVAHNIEMVQSLYPVIRPRADYERSVRVLKQLRSASPAVVVKSGFMVGLGESEEEVRVLLADLAKAGCDIVTIGQYLAPGKEYFKVQRFVSPDEFEMYKLWAREAGITTVVSAPLVRSSYLAEDGYNCFLQTHKGKTF